MHAGLPQIGLAQLMQVETPALRAPPVKDEKEECNSVLHMAHLMRRERSARRTRQLLQTLEKER